MKKILLMLILATLSFAATYYKDTAFIAENTLYCTDYYGKQITEYKKGDIISSEQAYTYCSYNLPTVENIKKSMSSTHNEQEDVEKTSFPTFVLKALGAIIAFLCIILFVTSIVTWIWELIEIKRKKLEKR